MAVTLDIGDEGCIHPAKKEEVGTRLAWLALSKTYGMKGIDADTPVCEKMEVADGKAYLTFATGPDGLAPYGRTLTGFEMAGRPRLPPGHSPDREGQKPPDRRVRRRSGTGRRALRLPQRSRSHPFQHLRHPRLLVPHRRLGGEVNACSNRPIRPRGQTSAAGFFQTRISGHVSRRRSGSAKRGFSGWRSR